MSYNLTQVNVSQPFEQGVEHFEGRACAFIKQGSVRVRFSGLTPEVGSLLTAWLLAFHAPEVAACRPEDFCDGGTLPHTTELEDLGRCDGCGREEGRRVPSLAGWLCEACTP